MMTDKRIGVVLACVMSLLAASCSQKADTGIGTVEAAGIRIPKQLLGLLVQGEDIAKQAAGIKQSYVDSNGMFSMREDDLLRATLQVSRLSRFARPKSEGFRKSIAALLGGTTPTQLRVGDTLVSSTGGNKQSIYVWFRGRGMFILSIHRDYEFPRTLLRRVVSLELK